MYQIIICDDDKVISNLIETIVVDNMEFLDKEFSMKSYNSGKDVVALLESGDALPDLFLLDVDMPGMTGLDVGRKMQMMGLSDRIIYISSHPNFIFESQKIFPFFYLRKNDIESDLLYVMQKYFQQYENNKCNNEIHLDNFTLPENHVLYMQKEDRKLVVTCSDLSIYRISKTLAYMEGECSDDFCKISDNCLINIRHVVNFVDQYGNITVTMSDSSEHRISRRRRVAFENKYKKFRRNQSGQYNIKYN